MSFGAALRQAREAQGVTLHDVAQKTKIRLDYLRALEEGNVAALPERTFARSYLQRYARELHLDASPLLADFDRTMPLNSDLSPSARTGDGHEGGRQGSTPARPRRGLNPAWLLAGLLLLGGAYYALGRNGGEGSQSATTPVTEPSTPQPGAVQAPTPPAEPVEAPAPRSVNLTVSSVPAGARVFLDNRELGVTPLRSFPVDARDRAELRVELTGRAPLRTGIALNTGRNLRATLTVSGQGPSTVTDLAKLPKPAPTAVVNGEPVGTPAGGTDAASSAPPARSPARSPVRVTFTGAAWTKVTDATGRVLYQGTPPAGSVKGFPAGVVIRTGNAGAVNVSVNGAPAQSMGAAGQVLSRRY